MQIFESEKEDLLKASDIFFGLSPKEVRDSFIHMLLHANEQYLIHGLNLKLLVRTGNQDFKKHPKLATIVSFGQSLPKLWYLIFLKLYSTLTEMCIIRSPQATSLARSTNFNKCNTNLFVDNLGKV